ncbi:hypothetical protein DFH07DRAFT_227964 [Mycena maculata]|uniref:Uncharacterized protein n=1 Tax=Mycena maculata TaxID=230809 RepID=A0AAD7JT33_9AGAR|nr:hypothetical protein DFH07DRAFT_227964 [Mycena maculata]
MKSRPSPNQSFSPVNPFATTYSLRSRQRIAIVSIFVGAILEQEPHHFVVAMSDSGLQASLATFRYAGIRAVFQQGTNNLGRKRDLKPADCAPPSPQSTVVLDARCQSPDIGLASAPFPRSRPSWYTAPNAASNTLQCFLLRCPPNASRLARCCRVARSLILRIYIVSVSGWKFQVREVRGMFHPWSFCMLELVADFQE